MSGPRLRLITVLGSAALLATLVAAPVAANGVTTRYVALTPVATGGGSCAQPDYNTIQDAVNAANPGDTIRICAGTYGGGTWVGTENLSFVGDGAATTILDGGGGSRLFGVSASAVSFTGLAFINGSAGWVDDGGAIRAASAVTVTNSTFTNNFADYGGAIYGDFVTVTNSTFTNNDADEYGGAIDTDVVTVTNSTFTNNSVYDENGGAISANTATVTNSTFTGNYADEEDGGAIYADDALTVTGSTFAGNFSDEDDGGAIAAYGTAVVANSTFSGNWADDDGGAIYSNGTTTITNDTFSGNWSWDGNALHIAYGGTLTNSILSGAAPQCRDSIADGGGNVVTDNSCPGTVKSAAQIQLGPLANNGGPTQTMALGPLSAAIDAGVNASCAAAPVSGRDQRGTARPQGLRCDSGAYEAAAGVTIAMISPAAGKVGTTVTLTGSGFTYVNTVTFNGVPAAFSIRSPSAIVTAVPVGATTGPIRVTTTFRLTGQSPYNFTVLR